MGKRRYPGNLFTPSPGESEYERGRFEEALRLALLEPSSADAAFLAGRCHVHLKDHRAAVGALRRAKELSDPRTFPFRAAAYLLGRLFERAGRQDAADREFRDAGYPPGYSTREPPPDATATDPDRDSPPVEPQ